MDLELRLKPIASTNLGVPQHNVHVMHSKTPSNHPLTQHHTTHPHCMTTLCHKATTQNIGMHPVITLCFNVMLCYVITPTVYDLALH